MKPDGPLLLLHLFVNRTSCVFLIDLLHHVKVNQFEIPSLGWLARSATPVFANLRADKMTVATACGRIVQYQVT